MGAIALAKNKHAKVGRFPLLAVHNKCRFLYRRVLWKAMDNGAEKKTIQTHE